MFVIGSFYEGKKDNNLYHIQGTYYHWITKETFVLFMSMTTGDVYVLEQSSFLSMAKKSEELNKDV